jgi:S-phase kinase-associated protein 1
MVGKIIKLKSEDGKIFHMLESHVRMCGTLKNILDDIDEDIQEDETGEIVVPISSNILKMIIDFCSKYEYIPIKDIEQEELELRINPLEGWKKDFVSVPIEQLFEMIKAANFIDLKQMLNICCKSIADKIKGKTPKEMKQIFGIEGDFTQEEKERVLRENPWLEETESTVPPIIIPSESGGGSTSTGESIILPSF